MKMAMKMNPIKRKNKRAQIPEMVMIIAALIVCSSAVYVVTIYKANVQTSVMVPQNVLDFYSNLDKAEIFNKDAGMLAINAAFEKALSKPASQASCVRIFPKDKPEVAVWSESCGPNDAQLKNDLLAGLPDSFSEITGKEKFSFAYEGDGIVFTPSEVESSTYFIGELTKYNVTHRFSEPFSLKYPEISISKAFNGAIARKSLCKAGKNFESCMGALSLAGWRSSSRIEGNHVLFDMKSEKSYFYDNSYKPFEFSFAIQKLS